MAADHWCLSLRAVFTVFTHLFGVGGGYVHTDSPVRCWRGFYMTHLFGVGGRGEGLLSDGLVLVTQSLVGLLVVLRHTGQESAAQRVGPLR